MVVVWQNLHQEVELKSLGLRSLRLNPPHTSRAVDDRVLRYDFTGVDLTEGSNDTAAGEDHIPTNVSFGFNHVVVPNFQACDTQPTSNTLFMPIVMVLGSTSDSGVMFSG